MIRGQSESSKKGGPHRFTPPLVITPKEMCEVCERIRDALDLAIDGGDAVPAFVEPPVDRHRALIGVCLPTKEEGLNRFSVDLLIVFEKLKRKISDVAVTPHA